MSYMYRALGTAAVGSRHPPCSVSLPHDQNHIQRVFFDGGPIIPLLLPARVVCQPVGCWPAVILPGCLQFLLSLLPYEEARSRPVRPLGRSLLLSLSVRPRVSPSPLGKWVSSTRRYLGLLCDVGGAVVVQDAALIYFKDTR